MCTLGLTVRWEKCFVYRHLRSTWALNENPKSNLCEIWEHSSPAADMHRHSPLLNTSPKWFMFKYSNWTWVLSSSFIKCSPRSPPASDTVSKMPQEYAFFLHLRATVFFFCPCRPCPYRDAATERQSVFATRACKCKDYLACIVQKVVHIAERKQTFSTLEFFQFFSPLWCPTISLYQYSSSNITEHSLALQNFAALQRNLCSAVHNRLPLSLEGNRMLSLMATLLA